jgi:nucleoside-diphosphate-sugar epimerase
MRDALAGRDVEVRSPGVVRSYLHGFEMAAVLMALLARGKSCEIYNLGSDVPVDMLTLSQAVAVVSHRGVKVLEGAVGGGSFSGDYYLPCMKKTWGLCGYKTWLSLRECVEQTMAWHRERAEVKLG